MLGSNPFPLPSLDFQDPILFCDKEIQTGLVGDEVGERNGNTPTGVHSECHPAGAYVFLKNYLSYFRIVIKFLHRWFHRILESHRSCPEAKRFLFLPNA